MQSIVDESVIINVQDNKRSKNNRRVESPEK